MRARSFDPTIGRFVSEDPALDGINWYAYANNAPTQCVDSSGNSGEFSVGGMITSMGVGGLLMGLTAATTSLVFQLVTTGKVNWRDVGKAYVGGYIVGALLAAAAYGAACAAAGSSAAWLTNLAAGLGAAAQLVGIEALWAGIGVALGAGALAGGVTGGVQRLFAYNALTTVVACLVSLE